MAVFQLHQHGKNRGRSRAGRIDVYKRQVQTIIGLLGFTAIFFAIFTALAQAFSFSQGEGRFAVFGFFYLVPFRLLYKEKAPILFVITCSGWSYTMGVLALTFQIVNIPVSYTHLDVYKRQSITIHQ